MLLARSSIKVGSGRMDWAVAFAPRVRISVVQRAGLVLDTRFVPASTQPPSDSPCLYIVLRGAWRASTSAASVGFDGPAAFVVSDDHLDGGNGVRSLVYRTDPTRLAIIEVHVDAADSSLRAGALPELIELDENAWAAVRHVCELAQHDDASMTLALSALLDALAELSLLGKETAAAAARPESPAFRLLWKALRPMAERLDLLPTVQQISAATGTTPRDVDRLVRSFLSATGLVGSGWRPASLHLRLKLAVIMLSAEDASIAEIARVIGYGSADAMARAFRNAELPAPGVIRDGLRAGANEDPILFPRPAK